MDTTSYIYKNKAAVLEKINKPLKIKNLKTKKIKENQLLVKIKYTFICGSQLNEIFGKKGKDKYLPHTLGHEAVGEVLNKGPGVKNLRKGDAVIVSWIKNSKKKISGAEHIDNLKHKVNSGSVSTFLKFAVIPKNNIYKIHNNKKKINKYALYGCAMPTGVGIALKAIKNLKKESFISIYGLGGIGLIVFATLKYFGYHNIIVIDKNKYRLNLSKKLGNKFNFNLKNFKKFIKEKKIKISMIKRSIETSGSTNLIDKAIEYINTDGKIFIAGNPPKGMKIKIDPYDIIFGKKIYGTIGGNISIHKNIKLFDKIIKKNPFLFNKFLEKSYKLNQINQAIDDFLKGKIIRPLIKI